MNKLCKLSPNVDRRKVELPGMIDPGDSHENVSIQRNPNCRHSESIRCRHQGQDLCRDHGISDATYYNWKAKYGGLTESFKFLNYLQVLRYSTFMRL